MKFDKFKDILPERGEHLRYIMNTFVPTGKDIYIKAALTMGQDYVIQDISFLPCGDRILIIDDHLMWHWVPLYKFNFQIEGLMK